MASRPRPTGWTRAIGDAKAFRWPGVVALCVLAFGLGVYGFAESCARTPAPADCQPALTVWDLVYLSLQLFIWQSGAILQGGEVSVWLQVARLLAPTAFGIAAVCAFMALFRDRWAALRARYRRGHVIVCGLGARGLAIARHLRDDGRPVVMVDMTAQPTGPRTARALGAVIVGDAADPETLRRAGVRGASHLVAVCGDDALNAEVAARAAAERTGRGSALTCHVHVATPALWERLRPLELSSTRDGTSRLQFFSSVDLAARAVVGAALPPADAAAPHLLVAGGGTTAERVVANAALAWRVMTGAARLRITVAETGADARVAALRAAYPRLADACDVVAAEYDPSGPGSVERLVALCQKVLPPTTLCLTGLDDAALLSHALGVRHATAAATFPIVVAAAREEGLDLLANDAAEGHRRLRIVGTLERGCTADAVFGGTHELLARAIHAEYVRQQTAAGETVASNPSMQPWSLLPERLRESNRRQADDLAAKIASEHCTLVPLSAWDAPAFEFSEEQLDRLAEREHERWLAERKDWEPGGTKSVSGRVSPHLVPWDQLPPKARAIDRHTVQHIPQFLARVGLGIRRNTTTPSASPSPRS